MYRVESVREIFLSRLACVSLLSAALLCSCGVLRQDEGVQHAGAAPVFIEAHNFISGRPGMGRLDVRVRIPLRFFVFVRARPESTSAPFVARADVAVEILDRTQTSIARNILRREMSSADQSPSSGADEFLEKMFSFELPTGEYTVATEISDLESSRRFVEKSGKIRLKDFSRGPVEISDVEFLPPSAADDSGPVSPVAIGGDIPFGRSACGYMEFVSRAPAESIHASFAIRAAQSGREASSPLLRGSLSDVPVSRSRFLAPVKDEEGFTYRVSRAPDRQRYSLWLPENGDTMAQGEYELTASITAGADTATIRHPFRIRWFDMPRSLRSFPLALEALRYLASDSELSAIRSASSDRQKDLFNLFWKRRDPTPATAFNERMAEFYRRADEAMEKFGSLREPNGIKTDRGKTFILYGPPGSIERNLRPGSDPQEIWSYPNLHKRLVFVDKDHHGDYRLFETGTL